MKDNTKRKIAFEISYFFGILKYGCIPIIIWFFFRLLFIFDVIKSRETDRYILATSLAITTMLFAFPYYTRLINWLKRWNPDYKPSNSVLSKVFFWGLRIALVIFLTLLYYGLVN